MWMSYHQDGRDVGSAVGHYLVYVVSFRTRREDLVLDVEYGRILGTALGGVQLPEHDIWRSVPRAAQVVRAGSAEQTLAAAGAGVITVEHLDICRGGAKSIGQYQPQIDRKSTRLNSSHA